LPALAVFIVLEIFPALATSIFSLTDHHAMLAIGPGWIPR
jgi:hypothetical protein